MSVGTRIRERRVELGMSQAELAKRAGVSQPTVSAYENDSNRDYRASVLYRIAAALDASPDYLRHGRGPKEMKDLKGSMRELFEVLSGCTDDEVAMFLSVVKTIKGGSK